MNALKQTIAPPIAIINGEQLLELPNNLYIPPHSLEIFLETFQGPLDLLLYLIRQQNFDILDIPVAKITTQYMEYIDLMRQQQFDLAAEYLVMAAWLAEIKSRMLLPRSQTETDEDEEDPRAALVRQLQEYERFSTATQELDARPRLERELYLVAAEFDSTTATATLPTATLNDLLVAFRNVTERAAVQKTWEVVADMLNVRDKITHILQRIQSHRFMRFEDLLEAEEGRLGLAVSFMAILELVRGRMLVVVQNEPFAPIHIKSISAEK